METLVNTSTRRRSITGYNTIISNRNARKAQEMSSKEELEKRKLEDMEVTSQNNINALCKMSDDTIAFGPVEILNMYNEIVKEQMHYSNSRKFKKGQTVKIIASFDELFRYLNQSKESSLITKSEVATILYDPYYTIENTLLVDNENIVVITNDFYPLQNF